MREKVLLGLGNLLGRDDAVGFFVASAFRAPDWLTIPAPSLENVWGIVEKERPEKLVIVDAAQMGLPPGSIRRLPLKEGAEMVGSTHGLPLSLLLSLVRVKEIVLIGIQPKEYGVGEGLSPEVLAAADLLVRLLQENWEHEIPELVLERTSKAKNARKPRPGRSPRLKAKDLRNPNGHRKAFLNKLGRE